MCVYVFPPIFHGHMSYTSNPGVLLPFSHHHFPSEPLEAQQPSRTGPSKGTSGWLLCGHILPAVLPLLADANSDDLCPPLKSLLLVLCKAALWVPLQNCTHFTERPCKQPNEFSLPFYENQGKWKELQNGEPLCVCLLMKCHSLNSTLHTPTQASSPLSLLRGKAKDDKATPKSTYPSVLPRGLLVNQPWHIPPRAGSSRGILSSVFLHLCPLPLSSVEQAIILTYLNRILKNEEGSMHGQGKDRHFLWGISFSKTENIMCVENHN